MIMTLIHVSYVLDFEKLQKNCKRRALEECYLCVSKVPVTNCLKVYGFRDGTSKDTLELYFESSKRSGGGDLESIELNKEDGTCLIFFKDHKGNCYFYLMKQIIPACYLGKIFLSNPM